MATYLLMPFLLTWTFQLGLSSDEINLESEIQTRDFCEGETLEISCGQDEVIVMSSSLFGRLKVGVCGTTKDYGHMGCRANKIEYLDHLCSGKRECKFKVSDHKNELTDGSTCPKDLDEYLKVEYRCFKVLQSDATTCHVQKQIPMTSPKGYLASTLSQLYGIGSVGCAYKITIASGKKLSLTLVNFALHPNQGVSCVRIANVIDSAEKSHPISLCRGKPREMVVLDALPSGDSQIEIVGANALSRAGNFLLKYEVSGCADPAPQAGRYTSRQGDQLTVKCNQTGETRYLVCKGNAWSVGIQDCHYEQGDAWIGEFSDDVFPIGILIIVSIGVALGVFIGGLLLIVIAAYMKRKQKESQRKQFYMIAPQDSSEQQLRTMRTMASNIQDPEGNPDCVQCTLQRSASAKQNTKEGTATYYPASSVDGSIKDYSMFDRGHLKEATHARNSSASTRTLLPGNAATRAHMYEHPKYTP